jgi:ABC-type spermidine/putrescine transport system permease subunit I
MNRTPQRQRPYWTALVLPLALYLLVFLVIPFINIIALSFYSYSPTRIWTPELTTANYVDLLDASFLTVLLRTLRLGLVCTVICVLFGYPLAYFLARAGRRVALIGLFFLVMPLMVSAVIRTFGWLVILGRNGLVNGAMTVFGLERLPLLYNETAVVIGLANVFVPFMVLPLMASIERINPALEEAARNLGASWLQTFRRVILPLSRPGLVSGCLLVYSAAISAFVVPMLMGGARVRVIGRQIYDQLLISYQWPIASAIATLLVIATTCFAFAVLALMRRTARQEQGA